MNDNINKHIAFVQPKDSQEKNCFNFSFFLIFKRLVLDTFLRRKEKNCKQVLKMRKSEMENQLFDAAFFFNISYQDVAI